MMKNKSFILALLLAALTSACAFSMPVTLAEYEQKRQEILSANIHASSEILSEAEQEADRRLEILKKLTNYRPDKPFYEFVSPENDQAVKTDLYYFLRQMPKGASLHSHSTALLSANEFFDLCMNTPNVYIFTAQNNSEHLHGELMFVKKGSRVPEGFETFATAAKNLGRWDILKAWTIGAEDKDKNAWDVLRDEFAMVRKTIKEPEVFAEYFRRAFMEHARDGLQRLEVRVSSSEVTEEKLQMLLDAYRSVKKEYPDFTMKFIVNETKRNSNNTVEKIPGLIDTAGKLAKDYPDLFIGIDLVGEEDREIPLKNFAGEFIKAKKEGKTFNLYLHAGESQRPENDMMIDAYILGAKRIGHGFNLFRYPELEKKLIENHIALEVCPISNQLLGYVSDLRDHHAKNYLKRGVPVVLAPDDPFMFSTRGSTYDFYAAVLAWDLGLSELKQLCINSIEYSGGTDNERQELKAVWQESWDEFIKRWSEPSGLDPLSELYFYETDKSKIIPVEKLRIVETVTPESVARAEKNMWRALTGEISRRKPLTVVARNDGKGTYCVFDGNNTYSAIIKRGVKNIPVVEVPRPYQKDVTTLEGLYEMNREAQDEFNALMLALQQELGGELKVRPSLKGEARIREKAKNQFDGDYSLVIDVLAGTLIFESEAEILNAVEKLKARDDVVWIGDRWNKPMDGGYRDFSINIRMSNGAIVELQIHHRGIIEAKEGESGEGLGHLIYIFMRTNRYRDDMVECVDEAMKVSELVYRAGLLGKLSDMDAKDKASALEIARRLSSQTSAREASTLLSELSGIILKTLGPDSSKSIAPDERNSTTNAVPSPSSK
ncbi:MAG: hypothetical protein IJL18_02195 [Synergistaceae bacterium]|nr:hypothetical protein [Synergistaceae bacterium]